MRKNYHSLCQSESVLECVVNVSEGRDQRVLAALDAACGDDLLDRHTDRDHHRSVYTLVGEESVRALATAAARALLSGPPPARRARPTAVSRRLPGFKPRHHGPGPHGGSPHGWGCGHR